MFMCKFLISCALIVAAHAGYAPRVKPAGYVAQIQPAATIQNVGYNGLNAYAPAYGAYNGAYNSGHSVAGLTNLALSLPHAGAPMPTSIVYPNHHTSSYSAPIYGAGYGLPAYGSHVGPATASTAAAAASKVDENKLRHAYAPVASYGAPY